MTGGMTRPEEGPTEFVIKVASGSRPAAVAGAIARVVHEQGWAAVRAIGAGAVNQAVKSIVLARRYLQQDGIDVGCVPSFVDVTIGGQEKTAVQFVIEPRVVPGSDAGDGSLSA